jgi:hypothetical protein
VVDFVVVVVYLQVLCDAVLAFPAYPAIFLQDKLNKWRK